jgi:hypothetical protein
LSLVSWCFIIRSLLECHQILPVRDQRWGRTGERRARESGARWGVAASELGLRENFCIYTCWFKFDWTRFQLSETETEPNKMIFLIFKLIFLGFYLGSIFSIFYPSIFLIGRSIFLSLYFLHIIKSSVYTAIIFQPKCLYLSSLF